MGDNNQNRLNQAIHLSQQGERTEARKILLQLIQENAKNEYAWLWLVDVCDSDRERKAVLSRSLRVNPDSKLLQAAMKRFVDTGSLDPRREAFEASPSQEMVEEPVAAAIVEEEEEELVPPLAEASGDLDWIRLEDELESDANGLDTISEAEFSRLSQEFFLDGEDEADSQDLRFDDFAETEQSDLPVSEVEESDLFLLNELSEAEAAADGESAMLRSDPFLNPEELFETKRAPETIDDRLKGIFDEEEGKQKRTGKRLPAQKLDFKKVFRYLLVIFLSFVSLGAIVLLGLFAVQFFDLDRYFSDATPTVVLIEETELATEASLFTETPEEEQAIVVPEATPEPTLQLAEVNAIRLDNLAELAPVGVYAHPFPLVIDAQRGLAAALNLKTIHLLNADGTMRWKQALDASRPIGGGFSTDGALLGVFFDDLQLEIWDTTSGESVGVFLLSFAMKTTYSDVEAFPQGATASVAFSDDNQYVAAAFWGGVTVWKLESGQVAHEYALPQDALTAAYAATEDIQVSMAFHPSSFRFVYGVGEDIFLVDVDSNIVEQNWKTRHVGSLAWIEDDLVLEGGYSLEEQPSYLSLWQPGALYAVWQENSLEGSRGRYLPRYQYLSSKALLAFEVEGAAGKVSVKIVSIPDGTQQAILLVDTTQPLLGMGSVDGGNVLAMWAQQPGENLEEPDLLLFWDMTTFLPLGACDACGFLAGIPASQYQLFVNDKGTMLIQYAQGIGYQQLGIPQE